MSVKRTLKTLSIDAKFKLIKEVESGSKNKDVAVKYGVPASTVSTILKNKQTIITAIENGDTSECSKRIKKPTYENVDNAVLEWFKSTRGQNFPISGTLIKEKALDFSHKLGQPNFKASTGWLDNWKRRNGICHKNACGESNDVSDKDCTRKRDSLPHLLDSYQVRDLFNADETGLFFKCLPDITLTFKKQKCHRKKHSKQRVKLMMAANLDESEKLTDKDIVEFCKSESNSAPHDRNNDINSDMEDDLHQPPSNDLVTNSLNVLRSFLKTNEETTDSLYNCLTTLEDFFKIQSKKSARQTQKQTFK